MSRAVLTIATGKIAYWNMAMELARSFELWNGSNDIQMFILTDIERELPKVLNSTHLITVAGGGLKAGFSSKLQLDQYAPADETLFIDADCFCLSSLDFVFEKFRGKDVSVVGGEISSGEWFGDVAETCARTGVRALPKFNGGIYFLARGPKAVAVYDRARALEPLYDDIGLRRLRGAANDELLMAISMAQEGCVGIPEDGTVMGEFLSCPIVSELDIVLGRCVLRNPDLPDLRHRDWFPLGEVRPAVVHFLGHHVSGWLYRAEVLKLRLAFDYRWPPVAASLVGRLYTVPYRILDKIREVLRPTFHKLFGPRRVRAGIR